MFFTILKQVPSLLKVIRKEHRELQKLIEKHQFNEVLSDNRYGLYSDKIRCSIITHQLFIPAGIFSGFIRNVNHRYLSKFSDCLVPDYENFPGLSGELSHGKHHLNNLSYIGPLSRFENACKKKETYRYKYLVILSGPQPQKNILEQKLQERLHHSGCSCAFVNSEIRSADHHEFHFYDLQNTKELFALINDSEIIISRSGYSTLMDLEILQKKAILIPTPGQPEQEYLGKLHHNTYQLLPQNEIDTFSF